MSDHPLNSLQRKSEFLVAIDSDGCAFDSMEIKHKECFIPPFIKHLHLQPVSKFARECCEFVNLYSKDRGANRFPAYLKALDLLAERPEVKARHAAIPALTGLRDWIKRETKLGNPTLKVESEKTGDPDLQLAYAWSKEVNELVDAMVHGLPPFPLVKESLERMKSHAELIVCSATPNAALQKEWTEHGIAECGGAICGQEVGTKKEVLGQCRQMGYAAEKILMIGDAPGDLKAAKDNGVLFYPINPGHEDQSWKRFYEEASQRFLAGTYAGEYEAALIKEFDQYLPSTPPWKK